MGKRRKTHYAVRRGRQPGIYATWDECKAQTDGFAGARFKGFHSQAEAEHFMSGEGGVTSEPDAALPSAAGIRTAPTPRRAASPSLRICAASAGFGNATVRRGASGGDDAVPVRGRPAAAAARSRLASGAYGTPRNPFPFGGGAVATAAGTPSEPIEIDGGGGRSAIAISVRGSAPFGGGGVATAAGTSSEPIEIDGGAGRSAIATSVRGTASAVAGSAPQPIDGFVRWTKAAGGGGPSTRSLSFVPPSVATSSSCEDGVGGGSGGGDRRHWTARGRTGVTVDDNDASSSAVYSSFAHRMMTKMGHVEGTGLGKTKQGIASPVKAKGGGGRPTGGPGIGYGCERLNAKQTEAVDLAKAGRNVFITGPAGTGKSVVLHRIIEHFRAKFREEGTGCWVAVGPTGPTAIALGGQTLHSFAGCGVPVMVEDFGKMWKKKKQWRKLRVMIVDEVSMIPGSFFDHLSRTVCSIRGDNSRPFGGIQLIMCGDFLQLPPIPTPEHKVRDMERALAGQGKSRADLYVDRGFAFQARAWRDASLSVVEMDDVFRQSNQSFVSVLHEIRRGVVSETALEFLKRCDRPLPPSRHGIRPTVLYAKNKHVTRENLQELAKLPSEAHTFVAEDDVAVDADAPPWAAKQLRNDKFFENCIADKELSLKEGAQVMLIKNEATNDRKRLVNGSRGKVLGFQSVSFDDDDEDILLADAEKADAVPGTMYPVVQFVNGARKVVVPVEFSSRLAGIGTCTRKAVPLKLAWAVTMHKSQGLTLDYVKADVAGVFADAQAYVALSRASSEDGLELRNFKAELVKADGRALAFHSDPGRTFPCWDDPWEPGPMVV